MIFRNSLFLLASIALLSGCSLKLTRVIKTENNYYVVLPGKSGDDDDETLNPEGQTVYLIRTLTNTVVLPPKGKRQGPPL